MGIVYRAVQLPINRPVAVKLLLPGPAEERRSREQRFQREAEATARLREEHTVRLFDYGVTERREPFLVMELLHGIDLERLLMRVGRLKTGLALWVVRQVLLGLAEAHALGITHRDLKPSNVFLAKRHTGKTCVKVVDFGIARFDGSHISAKLTDTGALIGTPAYMPPEQLLGAGADPRGDLYSVGALLFETLTGRPPFEHGSLVDVLSAHVSQRPPRLNALVPTLCAPASLQELVDGLLAKRPEDRPQDCSAALQALDAVQRELRRSDGARGTPLEAGAQQRETGRLSPAPACAHCAACARPPRSSRALARAKLDPARVGSAGGWVCLLVLLLFIGRQLFTH
jgi:serine/threonine-protein kinase